METKRINLKVTEELYAWVKYTAKSRGLTMTELLNRILERQREEDRVNEPKQY